jgi:hypothetical protein
MAIFSRLVVQSTDFLLREHLFHRVVFLLVNRNGTVTRQFGSVNELGNSTRTVPMDPSAYSM